MEKRFGEASAATTCDATSAALINPPSSARRKLPGSLLIRLRPTDHDGPLIRSGAYDARRKTIVPAARRTMTESFFLLFSFCRLSRNSMAWPDVRTQDLTEVETTSEALRSLNIYFFV